MTDATVGELDAADIVGPSQAEPSATPEPPAETVDLTQPPAKKAKVTLRDYFKPQC